MPNLEASNVSAHRRGILIQCSDSIKEYVKLFKGEGAMGIFISEIKNFIMKNKKYIIGYLLLQLSFIMLFKLMLVYKDEFSKKHIDVIAKYLILIEYVIFFESLISWFAIQSLISWFVIQEFIVARFAGKCSKLLRGRLCDLTEEGANVFENKMLKLTKSMNDYIAKSGGLILANTFLKFTQIVFSIILLSVIEDRLYKHKKYLFFFACVIIKNILVIAMLKNSSYYFRAAVVLYYILHKFSNLFHVINPFIKEVNTAGVYFQGLRLFYCLCPASYDKNYNIDERKYSFEDGISAQDKGGQRIELQEYSSNYDNLFFLLKGKGEEEKRRAYEGFMNDRMDKFLICALLSGQDSDFFKDYMSCFFQCYCKMISRHGCCLGDRHETCHNFSEEDTTEVRTKKMRWILSNFSYVTYVSPLMSMNNPDDKLYEEDKFNWAKIKNIKNQEVRFFKEKKSLENTTGIIKEKNQVNYDELVAGKFFKLNWPNL
jgi:hypothetical protein